MSKYDDRPYLVGKGKPPAEHRFSPGVSGNPKGRRKKADEDKATMDEHLAEIINTRVSVTRPDGTLAKFTFKRVILQKLVQDAVNGTPAQRLKIFNVLSERNVFDLMPKDKQRTPEQEAAAIQAVIGELAEFAAREDPKYAAELEAWKLQKK